MKTYIKVDAQGNIAAASTDARDGWLEVPEGVAASPGLAYVADDEFVAYTPEQAEAKAAVPTHAAQWDNATMSWVDPRSLADLKAAKLAEMQEARDAQQYGGFTWDGSTFDSNERSQTVLLGMFTTAALGSLPDTPFRLQNNSWRVLTAANMVQVWAALQACVAGAFAQFAAREAAIADATTPAAVAAITWS